MEEEVLKMVTFDNNNSQRAGHAKFRIDNIRLEILEKFTQTYAGKPLQDCTENIRDLIERNKPPVKSKLVHIRTGLELDPLQGSR